MRWDPIHNTLIRDEQDADIDERGLLKDGHALRVRTMMMDSTQIAVSQNEDEIEDEDQEVTDRQALYDWQKAELSARWKGGLQAGDQVRLGDKDLMVSGRNPNTGKVVLSDASTMDADEIKQRAYDAYEHDIQTAWMKDRVYPSNTVQVGMSCVINGEQGRWARKGDQLVCIPQQREPDVDEFALAGPLSDSDSVQRILSGDAQAIKDAAYAEHENWLVNAWRRKE